VTEVRRIAVPDAARKRSTLERIDYADAFSAPVGALHDGLAEAWARLTLSEAPARTRTSLIAGWTALGLALRRGAGTILGWTVRESTPDVALLGADSHVGMPAQLLFERREHDLLFCTFVSFGSPAAAPTWKGVEPVHVRVVPRLLADVCRRTAPQEG
jgi:hypothetical protein